MPSSSTRPATSPGRFRSRQASRCRSIGNSDRLWKSCRERQGDPIQARHPRDLHRQSGVRGPVYTRLDLDPSGAVPVHLNVFADRPELLAIKPEQLERTEISCSRPTRFSVRTTTHTTIFCIRERSDSTERPRAPSVERRWQRSGSLHRVEQNAYGRDLLAHEFTHSWNGKFRRPADLWTPNYKVPMQDSLLWVYEGQTEYWGQVLTARLRACGPNSRPSISSPSRRHTMKSNQAVAGAPCRIRP